MAVGDAIVFRNEGNDKAFGAAVLVVGLIAVFMVLATYKSALLVSRVVVGMSGVVVFGLYRFFFFSRLVASGSGVAVLNPLSTSRLRWDEIAGIDSGPFLTINVRDGRALRVWAVQANNADLLKGLPTYVDEVAARLADLSEGAGVPLDVAPPDAGGRRLGAVILVTVILVVLVLVSLRTW